MKRRLIHGLDQVLVAVGQFWLLTQKFSVEVVVVTC